ncbi:hypothetical protein, partial [Pseudomonas putida]|uniref:hypothetical protein n=1 Tax=Pseudomonas putida TaxID=303 RepID=UPI001E3125D5
PHHYQGILVEPLDPASAPVSNQVSDAGRITIRRFQWNHSTWLAPVSVPVNDAGRITVRWFQWNHSTWLAPVPVPVNDAGRITIRGFWWNHSTRPRRRCRIR